MANAVGSLRLFGVDIVVTTGDDEPSDHDYEIVPPEEKCFEDDDQKPPEKFCTVDDDDHVDTPLKLPTSVSTSSGPPVVYNPMPLRCFPPAEFILQANFELGGYYYNVVEISPPDDHVDTTLSLSHASSSTTSYDEKGKKPRKRKRDNISDEKKKQGRSTKRKRADDQDSVPIPSLEEIPGLLQTIESRKGTNPVFLYQKKLEESDVSGHHNRLFVTRRQKLVEFLNDDEVAALNHRRGGVMALTVDPRGNLYELGLKIWQSIEMMVVNLDWNKLVTGNNAHKGDWVQIWGYREDEKLRFAINFRKCEA